MVDRRFLCECYFFIFAYTSVCAWVGFISNRKIGEHVVHNNLQETVYYGVTQYYSRTNQASSLLLCCTITLPEKYPQYGNKLWISGEEEKSDRATQFWVIFISYLFNVPEICLDPIWVFYLSQTKLQKQRRWRRG